VLLNALKESCQLQCGSAMPAMSLSPASQRQLAASLACTDPSEAHGTYVPVRDAIDAAVAAQLGKGKSRCIPLRVFTSLSSWRQLPVARDAPPPDAAGRADGGASATAVVAGGAAAPPTTLLDVLSSLLPSHFGGGGGDATGRESAEMPTALVQGVGVPLQTPLGWLADACSHPDGWLYVCVPALSAPMPPPGPAQAPEAEDGGEALPPTQPAGALPAQGVS